MTALGTYPGEALPLGNEAAGRVTAIGDGVTRFAVGDDVVFLGPGCFATHACVSQQMAALRSSCLSAQEAATIPIAFLSALYALNELAKIRAGERVLILNDVGATTLDRAEQHESERDRKETAQKMH